MRQRAHPSTLVRLVILALLLLGASGMGTASARRAAADANSTTLRVAYTTNLATMDPTQAYTDDWWLINGTIFNGLYQFDRNGRPQLNLAAKAPVISADRKTWTFTIRGDARFSNGMPVTSADFKYSIMRTLDPHLKPAVSWGQTTDAVYEGAQAYIAGKSKDVPGIQVVDSHTIRFVLAQPVAVLPYLLASTYNMVVPEAVYAKETADQIASHPIGAGPYMLQSWQRGSQAVFARNPYYFRGAPPVARIIAYENVSASLITLKIQKGELDGFGNDQEVDASDLRQLSSDPRYSKYLYTAPSASVVWLDLDVHVPPLDNPKVRQAIAMAINRQRLVQLLGGNAIAATQMYIPLDAQHDPALDQKPIYTYDPNAASALIRASGSGSKPLTVLYGNDASYYAGMAPGIQQQLQQIGLNVTLRGVTTTELLSLGQPLTGHQISFALWSMDYPDGYDIYTGAMACGANAAGGVIAAHYCDAGADTLVTQSQSLPLGESRNALLRQAQTRILQSAAHIPLVFLKSVEIVSPRVKSYYYQPAFGWQFASYHL
jgi:ABC-type transport system substrate-binding protein